MKIIITDTNILFDVIKIGALPEFFSLDYEICTTVFVIHEILPSRYFKEHRRNPDYRFDFWKFIQAVLAGCALGALSGIVIDKIEPAINPNQRILLQYYFLVLLSVATYKTFMERYIDCLCRNLVITRYANPKGAAPGIRLHHQVSNKSRLH